MTAKRAALYVRDWRQHAAIHEVFDATFTMQVLTTIAEMDGYRVVGQVIEETEGDTALGERDGWQELIEHMDMWDVLLVMRPEAVSPRADVVEAVQAWLGERERRLEWPGMTARR